MEQWNQIENPKADSHIKRYLIYGKDSMQINRKIVVFLLNVLGQLDIHMERNESPFLHPNFSLKDCNSKCER